MTSKPEDVRVTEPPDPVETHPPPIAVLRWRDRDGTQREHFLRPGNTILLGRDVQDEGIPFSSMRISRRHAVLAWHKERFVLRDLGSKNGTYVNGKRIEKSKRILPGDLIELGDVKISYFAVGDDLEDHAKITDKHPKPLLSHLIATSGPHEDLHIRLSSGITMIGRNTGELDFTVALQDPTVSAPHASIVQREKHFVLADLGSENGTKVNGQPVEAALTLHDGDVIQIGVSIFLFRQS